ncbi:MAG TPA: histidine phosphatase family protein [Noviherbaspirillum sp.]|nr:histidine phosphatase family protein [Noviherbaspirillum sp.]
MRLYLVRHAQPDVSEGVCYGSTDLPVRSDSQQRALAHLANALPKQIPIFSSPLQRCRTLAVALSHELGADFPALDARLVEMDFGAWEMRAWSEIPREEVDAWAADLQAYRPGGGENLYEVARRVQAFHEDLRARRLPAAIVVGHAGTIRLLLAGIQCTTPEEMVARAAQTANKIPYGEVATVNCQSFNMRHR